MQGNEGVETALTEHVQLVGVGDGAVLVLHHAGVVATVRRHGALHHQAPLLVSQLGGGDRVRLGIVSHTQDTFALSCDDTSGLYFHPLRHKYENKSRRSPGIRPPPFL